MIFRRFFQKRGIIADIPGISGFTNPADWLIDLLGNANTQSGETVTANTAPLNSNVYTCASILGGDIGKLPIRLYKKKSNGLERDESHPVAQIFGTQPNPYMTAYTFKETLMMHLVSWGNAYAYIEWGSDGRPKSLFPLHPALTDVRFDLTTGEIWYVTTFPFPGGETRKIRSSDMFHLKAIGTSGLKGITPIAVIREKLGVQQSSDKFLGSFYSNGTATSGLLKIPGALDKPAKDRAREEWQKLHTGLSNAHKIAILDAGMEYQALGMPLKDAEFIETMKFGIAEVAKIYKIPPHKVGLMDKATFSNIEHQSLEYVKSTLTPLFVNWEQEIRRKLFTELERKRYYVKFDDTSELRGDSKSRAEYYEKMIQMGVFNINEVREQEERDNIGKLGDKHLISLNYTTLDNLEEYQKAKAGIGKEQEGGEVNGQKGDPVSSGTGD